MSERSITVAAVQSEPVWFDLAATTEKTIALIAEAARKGAQVIAFPEVWLPGYPVFLWLGDEQWQANHRRTYIANSAEYGGPEHKRIAAAAAEHGITVVLGVSERDADDRIFIAQWIMDEMGKTVLARAHSSVFSISEADPEIYKVAPEQMLNLLSAVAGDAANQSLYGMNKALEKLEESAPGLIETKAFQKLKMQAMTL